MPTPVHTDYLARLDHALVGPRRARRSLLTEAADHLEDATEALVDAGAHPDDAADRALADFGAVEEVAPAFQETLAVAASRRTAGLMLLAMGAQPFLWDKGLRLAASMHLDGPHTWAYQALDEAIEIAGSVVLVGALLAVLATGVGSRWVPARRPVARATAVLALGGAFVVPCLCITMTAMSGAPLAFWGVMSVLMVAPLATVAVSARQTLAAA